MTTSLPPVPDAPPLREPVVLTVRCCKQIVLLFGECRQCPECKRWLKATVEVKA